MKYFNLSILFLISTTASMNAQKIKLASGSLQGLKGQKSYNIVFSYHEKMIVGTEVEEKTYLAEKKKLWDEKEPGKGDAFVQMWYNDRKKRFEPAFIKNFEHYSGIKLGDPEAKYTLVLKTTRIEGGWNLGVASHPGEIDAEMTIAETSNLENIVATIVCDQSLGKNANGGDFEMTLRIQSAYAQAGRWLADFLRRKAK